MPVFRRHYMSERVSVVVNDSLGIACGARCKIQSDRICRKRLYAFQFIRSLFHEHGKVDEPFYILLDGPQDRVLSRPCHGLFHPACHIIFRCADDRLELSRLKPVNDVIGSEHVGHRSHYRAKFMHGNCDYPVLPVTFQGYHDPVASSYACVLHGVGRLIGQPAQLAKSYYLFVSGTVAPYDGSLVRLFLRYGVHHVIGKVEIVRIIKSQLFQPAVLIEFFFAESFINAHFSSCFELPKARNLAYRFPVRSDSSFRFFISL